MFRPARRGSLFTLSALLTLVCATSARAQLTTVGNYRITQTTVGALVEVGDRFGEALAAGDFDRDGWVDLAVGVPGEDVGAISNAGAVYVAWGSPSGLGLESPSSQALHQDVAGIPDAAETDDRFGASLAVGDFNGDGYDDLAVGVPGEGIDGHARGGAVHVFLGGSAGLSVPATNALLSGDLFFPVYETETDANFGSALIACDRNGDGRHDLAVGAPSSDNAAANRVGKLLETRGAATGIGSAGAVLWTFVDSENDDQLGLALACGELDGDGEPDLIVGAPFDSAGGAVRSLTSDSGVVTHFATGGGTRWGNSVAAADFRGDGTWSLAIGHWGWDSASVSQAGQLAAGPVGNSSVALTKYRQGTGSIEDVGEGFDHFGERLAVGDFNRDGRDDLVVGIPDEDLYDGTPDLAVNGGMVQVVPGSTSNFPGLDAGQDAVFHWGAFGLAPLDQDTLGEALAVGDFNRDGIDDLAIGAPGAEWSGQAATGIVQILFGSRVNWIFGDGFEAGGTSRWSGTSP